MPDWLISLIALPEPERLKVISNLTPEQAEAIAYDWRAWARADQLPPPGDWRVWLVKAGRGWGKTRVGSEWVHMQAEHVGRIALVAPTAADARDVMVEGESGILACAPGSKRPTYEPSKRRLTWPNGAIATTYSADEPDRLRGPQHGAAWCLAGDTPVLMADDSETPLAEVRIGDMVATRKGPRMVTGSALTKRNAEVFLLRLMGGQSIIGTADHPVWVDGRGFMPLALTSEGMSVCVTTASSGAAPSGTVTAADTTSERSASTGRSGRLPTALCRKATTFITSMVTRAITALKTLSCSHTASIALSTSKRSSGLTASEPSAMPTRHGAAMRRSASCARSNASFAAALSTADQSIRRASARRPALKKPAPAPLAAIGVFASNAESLTPQPSGSSGIAQSGATTSQPRRGLRIASSATCCAPPVAPGSDRLAQTPSSASEPALSLSTRQIVSVERLARRVDVYDIAVDDAAEFFANGILVHNCDEVAAWKYPATWDMLMFGLRLGRDPRAVATTTPKMVPHMRAIAAAPHTVITRGRTYDNAANLAPAFLAAVVRKYEGTRLGRQELEGEDLDDNPHALWQRGRIDELRRDRAPECTRIVVAVDPAITSDEDSDETGIVAEGLGVDGHGYVLEDASQRGTPDAWARAAVGLYHAHQADVIVAEANQGGEMVRHVIHTVDPNAHVKLVHASRGKLTRAEPIAALYEQGRYHHVGSHPHLEDQMCTWQPGLPSPDRMDALVWGATELFLTGGDLHFA